nr:DUF2345 domain-containing protein [Paludibacterium denitrificans]
MNKARPSALSTNLNLIAQRDSNHTTGRRWLHNVGQHISLFVAGVKDKVALKLIAAKGKVQVQAQSGEMELTADQDVTVTSCKGKVTIAASQEILLTSGGGYIRLKGGNIEIHCPGTVSVKGAKHVMDSGTSLGIPMPWFKETHDSSIQYKILDASGNPVPNFQYQLQTKTGLMYKGITDENGYTQRIYAATTEIFTITKKIISQTAQEDLQPASKRVFDDEE